MQAEYPDSASAQTKGQLICAPPNPAVNQEEDEIDLLELWNIIWQGKWFIMGFTFLATLAAVLYSLFVLPVIYRSEAVLLPTEQQGTGSPLSGLVGSLLPLNLAGGSSKSNQILAFLNSRDLQQRLIEKYNLLAHYNPDLWDAENQRWLTEDPSEKPSVVKAIQTGLISGVFSVSQNRDTSLISIAWEDEDPAFAASMVERVIAELRHFLDNEYETDAKREREFIEKQLAGATEILEHWEQQVPTHELTLARILRERATAQAIYTELRKQLELAKISEAKEVISFKVLDQPWVPELKYKPKRALICAATLVASGFLSVFLVLGAHAVKNIRGRQAGKAAL